MKGLSGAARAGSGGLGSFPFLCAVGLSCYDGGSRLRLSFEYADGPGFRTTQCHWVGMALSVRAGWAEDPTFHTTQGMFFLTFFQS